MLEKTSRLTLEDLLDRSRQSDSDKMKIKEFYSKELGGKLQVVKIPLKRITTLFDKAQDAVSISESLDMNIELIYKSVPLFQNKELQASYDCTEPYDVVTRLLNDNVGEINSMAEYILSLYGLAEYKPKNSEEKEESLVDELKN